MQGVILTLLLPVAFGSLMAIDYGNEFFKISLIQPGRAIEIVSNVHTKRKTETAISFYEPARLIGTDATAHEQRGRKGVYYFSNRILGLRATEKDNFLGLDKNYYPVSFLVNSTRESVMFDVNNGMHPEELHGHILNYAKKIAEAANEDRPILDVVICIPADATQRVRQAYVDAAEVAGLKPQLIHATVAAAVQLALDWTETTPQNYLFYNMGSRMTEVCIVELSARAAGMVAGRTAPALQVKACVADDKMGGHFADIAIADHMLKIFKEKHAKIADGIENNLRARKKLLSQAKKTKHILSANKQASFNIASFHEDTDFQAHIDRATFEEMIKESIVDQLENVVDGALKIANMTKGDIDQVELIGGSWRIPKILETLSTIFKNPEKPKLELGQHLNGEEAMATGAALFGANSSSVFRVKRIFMQDVARYNYSFDVLNLQGEEIRNRTVLATAYKTKLNFKKKISLANHTDNFVVKLYEDDKLISTSTLDVASIMVSKNITDMENTTQKVSFTIAADDSGIIHLKKPEVVTERIYEEQVVNEEIMKFKTRIEVERLYDEWLVGEEIARLATMTQEEKDEDALRKLDEAMAAEDLKREEEEEAKKERDEAKKEGDEAKKEGDEAKKEGDEAKNTEEEGKKAEGEETKKDGEEAEAESDDEKAEGDEAKKEDEEAKGEDGEEKKADGEEGEKKDDKKDEKKDDKKGDKKESKKEKKKKSKAIKDAEMKKTMEKIKKEKKMRDLSTLVKIDPVYKTVMKKKKLNDKVAVDTTYSMPLPADEGTLAAAKENLQAMEKKDNEASQIGEVKNTLESTVYSYREKLEEEALIKVMLEEDRAKVRTMSEEIENWLYEDGMTADLMEYIKRLSAFKDTMEPALLRAKEVEKRADLIERVSADLDKIAGLQEECKAITWLNTTKVEAAEVKLAEFKTFWEDVSTKQKNLKDHEEPAYHVANVTEKLNKVVKAWMKLKKTKKPKDSDSAPSSKKGPTLDLKGKTITELNSLRFTALTRKNEAVLKQDYDAAHLAKSAEEQIDQAIMNFYTSGQSAGDQKAPDAEKEEKKEEKAEKGEEKSEL